jgi:hypothetical protein
MYAKCGSLEDAWGVFNKMPSQVVVTWSTMILGDVKWSLKMLLVMYCCQTSMLLLAIYISVRMLNIRERKKV